MKASDEPRKGGTLMNGATQHISAPPKRSIIKKSAVRPRKDPSSSNLRTREETSSALGMVATALLLPGGLSSTHVSCESMGSPAVSDEKEHVEQEVEAERSEEEEVGEESPYLELVDDELRVEVEREGRDELKCARARREHTRSEVHTRDGRHLQVPVVPRSHGAADRRCRLNTEAACSWPAVTHSEAWCLEAEETGRTDAAQACAVEESGRWPRVLRVRLRR